MSDFDEAKSALNEQIKIWKSELDSLQNGGVRHYSWKNGEEQRDVTNEVIETLTSSIRRFEGLIQVYEKMEGGSS